MSDEKKNKAEDNVGEEGMGIRKSLAEDGVFEQSLKRRQNCGTISGKCVWSKVSKEEKRRTSILRDWEE